MVTLYADDERIQKQLNPFFKVCPIAEVPKEWKRALVFYGADFPYLKAGVHCVDKYEFFRQVDSGE